jgi:FtsP/CotA-like multicopper oxidase with cupredoxin domain
VACTEDTITFNDFSVLSATTSPQLNLINGARQPRLITSPSQTERWRILNAAFLDEVWLGAFRGADKDCSSWSLAAGDALPLQQIGRDGIVLPQPFSTDFAFLSSGYRLEALVGGEGVFQHGDTWCLVSGRYLQSDGEESPTGEPVSPRTLPTEADIRALLQAGDLVAIVNVTEDKGPATETRTLDAGALSAIAKPTTIDGVSAEDRCAAAAALSDPATIDQVAVLQVGIFTFDDPDPCGCDDYNINCNNFEEVDRSRYPFDRDLPLNAVEHWRVGASIDGHPFHIHINPFVVCPNDNPFDPIPFPHWRDTYLVNLDRKVDLITQYSAFTGAFVTHCHKLTHEDHGMMQLLRVCDPATDPTCGDNHWRDCDADDLECVQHLAATDCSIWNSDDASVAACMLGLGALDGVCGPNACVTDTDCGPATTCVDYVCTPG